MPSALRALLALLLAVPLPAQTFGSQANVLAQKLRAADPQTASQVLRDFFDGGRHPGAVSAQSEDSYAKLQQERELLSLGTPQADGSSFNPFVFHYNGGSATAQAAGLEGFVYSERELAATQGQAALQGQLADYENYFDALLAPIPWAQDARAQAAGIMASSEPDAKKFQDLTGFINNYTDQLRAAVAADDQAQWIRQARVYELFPRAYNLPGKRQAEGRAPGGDKPFFADFGTPDLLDIKGQGFDTLWVMGIFPIGKRGAFGTAGGSPYSVMDHESVNPDLGTMDDFAAFVARAHAVGMKVIIDFIPNHTSMDSKLLAENPDYFIHRDPDPSHPDSPDNGYFVYQTAGGQKIWVRHGGYDSYGQLAFWDDTAQLDYSRPATRARMIGIVREWVARADVDGFRVDMAYQILNRYFAHNWGLQMPPREFLDELITGVKSADPSTGFIAEAYDGWDELSTVGFDLIYGKNDMNRPGGQAGWYDSLVSRDPGRIGAAVARESYLQWQDGGSAAWDFIGNHDEASPARAFGPWQDGAAFLTLLMPAGELFYGSQEIGFDKPNLALEPKSIPFSVPVQVDWQNADPQTTAFYQDTFAKAAALRQRLPGAHMEPLAGPGWAGYALVAQGQSKAGAVVIANPTGGDVPVEIHEPSLGLDYSGSLPALGYQLIDY